MTRHIILGTLCVCSIFFQLAQTRSLTEGSLPSEREKRSAYEPPPKNFELETIDEIIQETNEESNKPATVDGTDTVELDMNLTPEQKAVLYCTGSECRSKRKATSDVSTRWPNGVIPYEITPGHFDAEETRDLKAALNNWQNLTCLTFRPATGADKNKVKYQNGNGCNSMVGMVGGTQVVNLQKPACREKGLYLHETGHAIGLMHEHQMPNRDEYIRIDMTKVAPGLRDSFKKYNPEAVQSLAGIEYDYSSIMHYGKSAFSYDGQSQTIYTRDKDKENLIGFVAYKTLSFYDIKAVNMLYHCDDKCDSKPTCKEHCFVNKHCKCFCKEDMPKVPCINKEDDSKCEDWASRGECNKNKAFMDLSCRKTCGICVDASGGGSSTGTGTGGGTGTAPEVCINKHGDAECEEWAGRGECDNNPEFLHKNCRKACGLCQSATKPGSTTTPKPDPSCQDKDPKCKAWKTYCGRNEHTTVSCPLTCGTCR